MPSRKLTDRCPRCHTKNHLRALYCNQCGAGLQEERAGKDADGRAKLYADIAHPINCRCREQIQARVMEAFRDEQIRARQPGYVCTYDDYGEESYADLIDSEPVDHRCVGAPGSVHRVEPAHTCEPGRAPVNQPHHATLGNNGFEPHPIANGRPWGTDADEGFGAGIV